MAADYNVTYIVNSDAHHPKDVSANHEEAPGIGQRLVFVMLYLIHLESNRAK